MQNLAASGVQRILSQDERQGLIRAWSCRRFLLFRQVLACRLPTRRWGSHPLSLDERVAEELVDVLSIPGISLVKMIRIGVGKFGLYLSHPELDFVIEDEGYPQKQPQVLLAGQPTRPLQIGRRWSAGMTLRNVILPVIDKTSSGVEVLASARMEVGPNPPGRLPGNTMSELEIPWLEMAG
jgi:hypothetical protein